MTTPFSDKLTFGRGFFSNQGLVNAVPDTIIDGKNMWIEGPERMRSWGGVSSFGSFGNRIMILVGNKIATLPAGSAASFRSGAIFFVGDGNGDSLFVGTGGAGTDLGQVMPTLKLSLDGLTTGVNAGLPQLVVNQSTLSVSPIDAVKKQQGSYSIKLTPVRKSTGAEGTASEASNVVTLDGTKMLRFQIPPFVTGQDAIKVYGSARGRGSSGPWRFYRQYDTALQGSIDLEWFDGELTDQLAPLDNDQPLTPATHVFILGNVVVLAGVLGGGGLSPSKPGRPEAFPPDYITFLNPNEPIIGIRGRPADGWQYVFCRNSLHAVILTGNPLAPVIPRAVWNEVGIAGASAAAFVGGEFYGFSAKKGALRTTAGNQTAEPDVQFALPVENYMETWTPENVVVGWDQDHDCVYYFHDDIALAYMRKLGVWSTPFHLDDAGVVNSVDSCITYQGRLIFSAGTAMFEMSGNQVLPFSYTPVWHTGGAEGYHKTIYRWRTACMIGDGGTLRSDLLTNFDLGASRDAQMIAGNGTDKYGKWKKTNVKDAVVFTIKQSGEGANQLVYATTVEGGVTKMTI